MNFLGIGVGELLLIMIIAAMVVGPERMVQLSRSAGRLLGKLRRETDAITKEFREAISTFDDVGDLATETKAALRDVSTEMRLAGRDAQAAVSEVKQIAGETKAVAVSAAAETTPRPAPAPTSAAATVAAPVAASARPATAPAAANASPARSASSAPPSPAVSRPAALPLLDGEVAVATPAVARGALPPDEATVVGLADLVPEDPAEVEPVEVSLPTLMVELAELEQAPEESVKPKPRTRKKAKPETAAAVPPTAQVGDDADGSQG